MDVYMYTLVLSFLFFASFLVPVFLWKRTAGGDRKLTVFGFFLSVFAMVVVYAVARLAYKFSPAGLDFPSGSLEIVVPVIVCVCVGLVWIAAAFGYTGLRHRRRFFFKSFRTFYAMQMACAVYLTFVCFFAFLKDSAHINLILLLSLAGGFTGVIWGWAGTRRWKGHVVNGKIILPMPFSIPWARQYFKAILIAWMMMAALILLSWKLFDSSVAWMAFVFPLYFGGTISQFIWGILYEKRNNMRLIMEFSESGQPIESVNT